MLRDIFSLVLCDFHTVKWCKESIYKVHINHTRKTIEVNGGLKKNINHSIALKNWPSSCSILFYWTKSIGCSICFLKILDLKNTLIIFSPQECQCQSHHWPSPCSRSIFGWDSEAPKSWVVFIFETFPKVQSCRHKTGNIYSQSDVVLPLLHCRGQQVFPKERGMEVLYCGWQVQGNIEVGDKFKERLKKLFKSVWWRALWEMQKWDKNLLEKLFCKKSFPCIWHPAISCL